MLVGMRRHLAAMAASVLLLAGALAGCSDSGGKDQPAVCSSIGDLKSSIADLKDVNVSSDGAGAVQDQLGKIKDAFSAVKEDAKDEYADQVDAIDADLSTLETSVKAAQDQPGVATLGALATAVGTLLTDAKTFVDDVDKTC